jgi:hypothetical protein
VSHSTAFIEAEEAITATCFLHFNVRNDQKQHRGPFYFGKTEKELHFIMRLEKVPRGRKRPIKNWINKENLGSQDYSSMKGLDKIRC